MTVWRILSVMFIKEIKKKNKGYDTVYIQHRLMESYRTARGPRQRTVLHLGQLDFPREHWKMLADRIEELLTGQATLLPVDDAIEGLARHYAGLLAHRRLNSVSVADDSPSAQPDYDTVDLNTMSSSRSRTIGAEYVGLSMFRQLGLDTFLAEFGLDEDQVRLAAAAIVGRLVHPGSEKRTRQWLRSLSGLDELLDTDFSHLSNNALYRISDVLLSHKEGIEDHLTRTERDLFTLDEKIILYDLTNTYFEGDAKSNKKAKRGRSKEKRYDRPLVTLGLVIDAYGFPKQSRMLRGNISEPATLLNMVEKLQGEPVTPVADRKGKEPKPKKGITVVIDAGIATEDNLALLIFEGYDYMCVARNRPAEWDDVDPSQLVTVKEKKDNRVKVQLFAGAQEHVLYCHSDRREKKEQAMKTLFQERFETDMAQARAALSKKGGTKKYDKVLQRIGRLRQKYTLIAHYYDITVDQKDGIATDIKWVFEKKEKAEERFSGAYFLRTSRTDLSDEKTLWSLYTMLTDVEDAFRCLKSDLKLRPVFHQEEKRSDAHLFEGVLAYHLLNSIRFKLKQHGIDYSWKTVRELLSSQVRITTTVVNKKGEKIYIRNCTEPEPFHRAVYKALGLSQTILPNKKLKI